MRVCMCLCLCSTSSLKQMIPVICCSSFEYCQPLGAGDFHRAFTTNIAPQCRAFSRALEIEKLKAPLFSSPEGAGDTNDWCITISAHDHRVR